MINVIELLHGQGIVRYDQLTQSYRRTIRAYKYYFENLSMIPEVLKFEVVDMINNRRIGSLIKSLWVTTARGEMSLYLEALSGV